MSLISLVVVLIIVGFLLYAVNAWLPMDKKVKQILNVVVIVVLVLWIITALFPEVREWQLMLE